MYIDRICKKIEAKMNAFLMGMIRFGGMSQRLP
jgi:hypothetical protein